MSVSYSYHARDRTEDESSTEALKLKVQEWQLSSPVLSDRLDHWRLPEIAGRYPCDPAIRGDFDTRVSNQFGEMWDDPPNSYSL